MLDSRAIGAVIAIGSLTAIAVAWLWSHSQSNVDVACLTADGRLEIRPPVSTAGFRNANHNVRFRIWNRSGVDMSIEGVQSSCGCTVIKAIPVRMLAADQSFELVASVTIPPEGVRRSELTLATSTGVYRIPVIAEGAPIEAPHVLRFPRTLDICERFSGGRTVRMLELVTIENVETEPWILRTESSNPAIRVSLSPPITFNRIANVTRRKYKIAVEAQVPEFEELSESSWVTLIAQNNEREDLLVNRCLVTVRSVAPVRLAPSEILFRVTGDVEFPIVRSVAVICDAKSETISELSVEKPDVNWLDVEVGEIKSRGQGVVRVAVNHKARDLEANLCQTEVIVRTAVSGVRPLPLRITISR